MKRFRAVVLLVGLVLPIACGAPAPDEGTITPLAGATRLPAADLAWLDQVMRETLDSIRYYRHPVTGFPVMQPLEPPADAKVQCDHLGLSLASIAVAGRIGVIGDSEARAEIAKTLSWIEKIPTGDGFVPEHIYAGNATTDEASWGSTGDMGFFPSCLIVIGEAYPEFKPRTDKLVKAMNWGAMYDSGIGLLKGCYRVKDGRIEGDGHCRLLACDQRLAIFVAIASGQVPADLWQRMPRNWLARYDARYMKPGEGLGFGEQPWALGYFLDERGSEVGRSNADLAWAQMRYAADMGYPAWGWSNCLGLTRYIGFGDPNTPWSVVNPHCITAAVTMYPRQVTKALRTLDRFGLRAPLTVDGQPRNFGFRASYDVDEGRGPDAVIPGLDQPIIFLSLANYLHDGIVWKLYRQNELVQNGIRLIPEYAQPKDEYLALYRERDAAEIAPAREPSPDSPVLVVDDFKQGGVKNLLGGARTLIETRLKSHQLVFTRQGSITTGLREDLAGVDLTDYRAIRLRLRAREPGEILLTLRLGGEGGYRRLSVLPEWRDHVIPLRSLLGGLEGFRYGDDDPPLPWGGMWHDRRQAQELGIAPAGVKSLEVAEIAFLPLGRAAIDSAAAALCRPPFAFIEKDGTFDRCDRGGWTLNQGDARAKLLRIAGTRGAGLGCQYSLPAKGGWLLLLRPFRHQLSPDSTFSFALKSAGGPFTLEVKLIDRTGAVFLARFPISATGKGWRTMRVPAADFAYGWGGTRQERPDELAELQFAITAPGAAAGMVVFDDLRVL